MTEQNPTNPQEAGGEEVAEMEGMEERKDEEREATTSQQLTIKEEKNQLPALPDYIPAEVTLENIGFFTPSSKRIKGIFTKEKTIKTTTNPDGTTRTIKTHISANYELGLPVTSDLDYWYAFEKLLYETADSEGRLQLPIEVPTKKLLRYAGKTVMARTVKEVRAWLERMTLTGIKGGIYRAKQKDYDDGFVGTVFSQVALRGEKTKNGQIADTNLVWLAPWYLSNYFYRRLRPRDHTLYQRLRKPIAKALAPLLETGWYASRGERPYTKRYSELCKEFLLTEHRYLADIKQQLDPAHRELHREQLLARWGYHPIGDPNHSPIDYRVIYHAGEKFFADQKARADRRQLAERIDRPAQPSTPSLSDREQLLLEDILTICGDPEHIGLYRYVLAHYPEELIKMTLSETRQADLEQRIRKTKGAYFIDTLKRLAQYREYGMETFTEDADTKGVSFNREPPPTPCG